MEYIILWNPDDRDSFVHTDMHGKPEKFGTYEEAQAEAIKNEDCADFRDFEIFQLAYE